MEHFLPKPMPHTYKPACFSKPACFFGIWILFLAAVVFVAPVAAESKNGFDLSNALIETDDIFSGGPPRDGIPSIDEPVFVAAGEVDYLRDDDIVIGVVSAGGRARAYPHRILVWHEIVNDNFDGAHIAVTYCPLCGTGMVFSADVGGGEKPRKFGVSGLLYHSDVLMYDRENDSLWSQLKMQAVSGPDAGTPLTWLPSEHLTWAAWKEKYPNGEVLSTDTGHSRNYAGEAYADYFAFDGTMFPVPHKRRELPNKARIAGVIINGEAKAYPLNALPNRQTFQDTVGGEKLSVRYDAEKQHPQFTGENNEAVPFVVAFWFAWQAFYPDTLLWTAAVAPPQGAK